MFSPGDVFQECRERVSSEAAARHYGLEFDRKGWCRCPFHHPDIHPSMSFKHGRFRCWACNASGDSIEFTGRLLGLKPMEAIERLNIDFALNLPLCRKSSGSDLYAARRRMETAQTYKAFEEWRETLISKLCTAYRVAHITLRGMKNLDELTNQEVVAIQNQARLEYIADCLSYGDIAQQMEIFRERGKISDLCKKILSNTKMKFNVAWKATKWIIS